MPNPAVDPVPFGRWTLRDKAAQCRRPQLYASQPDRAAMSQISTFNDYEVQRVREIAESGRDEPVLMLNLNLYSADADFPNGGLYQRYMSALAKLLPEVGAEVLWRHNVSGQIAGNQKVHEILALWYPSHRAFIDLRNAPSAAENFQLRALAVEHGVIHRLSGFVHPGKWDKR